MRYVAAYLLATLGGNTDPCKEDLVKILSSVGLDVDEERLDMVVSQLKGKDIATVIAEGSAKLASMPSGGGASSGGAAGGGAEAAPEEKKEEKKEESEPESDDDMGFGLFD